MPENVAEKCFAGGLGCGCAGFLTNPSDVVKIRNQQYGGAAYGSFLGTFKKIYVEEGYFGGLLKGVKASVLREATYSSVRMGMYEPIKDGYVGITGFDGNSMGVKWISSFSSGALGGALFNPVDLVKVRFQAERPPLHPRPRL